jgi:hypothetical protein
MLSWSKAIYLSSVRTEIARFLDQGPGDQNSFSAVKHPNGFVKLVGRIHWPETSELRIHWWSTPTVWSDIHNHTSAFASLLISGELAEEGFEIVGGNTFSLHRCISDDDNNRIVFREIGPVGIKRLFSTTHHQGEFRFIEQQQHHRVRALTADTVTVAVKFPATSDSSDVVAPSGKIPAVRPLSGIDHASARDRLERVVRLIDIMERQAVLLR